MYIWSEKGCTYTVQLRLLPGRLDASHAVQHHCRRLLLVPSRDGTDHEDVCRCAQSQAAVAIVVSSYIHIT